MEAAAGITGLILFVGKIAKEAASFFDGWSEAPTDVRLILRNFQHLQGFLEDLDDALKTSIRLDTPLAVNEEAKFRAIMDDCNETFAQMEKLMKTYHDVSSNLRTRTIWLAYGQDEYAKIGRSIESHKTTFMMRLALISFVKTSRSSDHLGVPNPAVETEQREFLETLNKANTAHPNRKLVTEWLEAASTYAESAHGGSHYSETVVPVRSTSRRAKFGLSLLTRGLSGKKEGRSLADSPRSPVSPMTQTEPPTPKISQASTPTTPSLKRNSKRAHPSLRHRFMRSIGYTPIQAKIMDADSLLGPLLGDTSCDLIDCLQGQGAMSRSILEQMVLLDGDLMASAFPGIPERSDIVELDSKSVYKPIPVELMGYAIMRPQELGDTSVTSHENTSQADIKITQDDAREKLTLLQAFEFLPVSKDKRSTIELGKPCWNVMLREIPFRRQKDIEETINKNPTPLISFDVLKQFEGLARRFTEAARKRDEANRIYSWRFHRFTYVSDCPSETESESETDVKWTVIIFLKRMPVVGADYVYEYQQAISAKNGFDEGEKLTNAVQFDLTIELPPSSAPRDADGVVDYLVSAFNLKPEPRYIQSTVLRRKYSFEESSDGTPEDRDTSPSESDATDTRELDKEIGAAGETESHAASEDGHDADNEEFQPAIVNNQAQNELAAQRINIELIEPEWLPPPVYRAMEPPVYIAYKPPPPTLDQKLS